MRASDRRLNRQIMGRWAVLIWGVLFPLVAIGVAAQTSALKPFTVAEEIGLTDFSIMGSINYPVIVSPDGRFVAVWSERGLLKNDRVEDDLRVYQIAALRRFVRNPGQAPPPVPAPVLELHEATFIEGPIISQIRWLPNSKGLAFLLRSAHDANQLMVMGLKQARPRVLSLRGQDVTAFDVRDTSHYVYGVASLDRVLPAPWGSGGVAWDGTGQPLENVLIRGELKRWLSDFGISYGGRLRSVLWGATADTPHLVLQANGLPIVIYPPQGGKLALSPDGQTLATALPVRTVPASWVRDFRPPFTGDPYDMLRAGRQKVDWTVGDMFTAAEYVLIDLQNGAIAPVDREPTGEALGWWTLSDPAWSDDSKALLLPDAYVKPFHGHQSGATPCVATFYPASGKLSCVKSLSSKITVNGHDGSTQAGFLVTTSLRFAGNDSDRVVMEYYRLTSTLGYAGAARESFVRGPDDAWLEAGTLEVPPAQQTFQPHQTSLDVHIVQGLNEPPVVVATDRHTGFSRTVWDPNPQLKRVQLGEATEYHWRDASGRQWSAGLYKPVNYVAGVRYPLVIQTHGFPKGYFLPSGWAPTAFAARALAASGIAVLQVPMCLHIQDPKFGPCEVAMYDSAARHLAMQGIIDPNRVGIIGFSETVFTVLDALTTSSTRYAAASVTDGPTFGYWEYLSNVDSKESQNSRAANATIGAEPFGTGLRLWQERAPEFNMQNVRTPLLVTSLGRTSLLEGMWEPYATLRYLHRPVDFVLLRSDEHVLSNPAVRLASQGGSVDWFRFWLQGYESPHPVMAGEYLLWERLCDVQREENPSRPTWCIPATGHRPENSNTAPASEN